METPNGYLCNLCHSLENDHPFPPESAQEVVVRFSKSENEQFGLPWDRGITCLEVWDTVLDFANPNVFDQASCRAMAAAYALQCCNDVGDDESRDSSIEQLEQQESNNEEETASSVGNSSDAQRISSDSMNDNNVRRTAVITHLRGRK